MHRLRGALAGSLASLLSLLLSTPIASPANEASPAAELNARDLNLLLYHPYQDLQGDEFGVAEPGTSPPRGYMERVYGADAYPLTVIDGRHRFEGAKEFYTTFDAYESALRKRLDEDSPLRLALMGHAAGSSLAVNVTLSPKTELRSSNLSLRVVVFEDEVEFDGGNDVPLHRFLVRAIAPERALNLTPGRDLTVQEEVRLEPSWDLARVGFVASVHNRDPLSPDLDRHEVLQSATFTLSQAGPTIQESRGVLLEMLTATWCPSCYFGDTVADELANRYGVPSSAFLAQGRLYLRDLAPFPLASAVLIALVAGGLAWHSSRRPGGGP